MMEVDNEVTVVGRSGFGERNTSDPRPVLAGEPLDAREAMFFSSIRHGDIEDKPPAARARTTGII